MDPQQQPHPQQQPEQPPTSYPPQQEVPATPQPVISRESQVVTPTEVITPGAPYKSSIKLPILLMVWPAAALILSILLYALANLLMGSSDGGLFGDTGPVKTILNVLLFITGLLSIFIGPISFIIGLVLLIVRKTSK